jgi:hypothetical protein
MGKQRWTLNVRSICHMSHYPHQYIVEKLQLRGRNAEAVWRSCVSGYLCNTCSPPFPALSIDRITARLVKNRKLGAHSMCPFQATDWALNHYFHNSALTRQVTDSQFRAAARELKNALVTATNSISAAFDRANHILKLDLDPLQLGWDIRQVKDDPWRSVVECHQVLQRMILLASEEAGKKPGRKGNTKHQSLVDAMLVAWERSNGRLPDAGNKGFQEHILAAFHLVER